MQLFEVSGDTTSIVGKFRMKKRRITFAVRNVSPNDDLVEHFKTAIHQATVHAMSKVLPSDKIGVVLEFKNFKEKGPGYITFRSADKIAFNDIWNIIESVIQSDPEALSSDTFRMVVTAVSLPQGRGKRPRYSSFEEECRAKRGITAIKDDDLNLPRALIVGKLLADGDPSYKIVQKPRATQENRARQLVTDAEATELSGLQAHLKEYKIVVYQYASKGRTVIFEGPSSERKINLLYHNGHYNVISSLTGAFECRYYCEPCHTPYNNLGVHRCTKPGQKVSTITLRKPGYRRYIFNNFEEESRQRKGIVSINNTDNLCLPRALVVGKAHTKKDPSYNLIRERQSVQKEKALKLMEKAGVSQIPECGAGIEELKMFQAHLSKYKITVYKYGSKGREIYYEGDGAGKRINLLFDKDHYNVITSLTAAFACSYFCEHCHVPYNTKGDHRCEKICRGCNSTPPCEKESVLITCEDCNRRFYNNDCYQKHLGKMCAEVKRCGDCFKTVYVKQRKTPHKCGEVYCKICRGHKPENHFCFIRPAAKMTGKQNTLFVFYDFETRQEKNISEGVVEHEVNLCVFQQACPDCYSKELVSNYCQRCGFREKVLKSPCAENFVSYLLDARKCFKQVVAIAHNGQAFDSQFVLNYILTKTSLKPELIMRGNKVLLIQVQNLKFIDSLNYFPMALSALPAAFGLPAPKGYFPHLFNTERNSAYVGPLPDVHYYEPDSMKPETRTEFMKWYEENKTTTFDMQRDLVDYCRNDVDILRRACLGFRSLFIEECNVDPFSETITIASACNLMYRRNYIEPESVGIIPKNGYRMCNSQSKVALQWLVWIEQTLSISIQHAGRQKETIICGVRVDGFCEETKQVFQFHGCYFHGCTKCFNTSRSKALYDDPTDTMENRYERTIETTGRFKNAGYDVVEMWECQFRKLLSSEPELKRIENHPFLRYTPLNPRDAFYGGRTEANRMKYIADGDEKIRYVDVCSLYPWVCKYGKFPIGHPQVYVGDECRQLVAEKGLENIDGLIKCSMLPPQHLYHPVLPIRRHEKLLFGLCNACSETLNNEDCTHTEEERTLTGTWVIDEVIVAVRLGYRMIEIQEIWKYKTTQYNAKTGLGGLFVAFINQFLKRKQEASGWPKNCNTEEEKLAYIGEYFKKEGVALELQAIAKNPGLRQLAKLILNSFWGKLGQRENLSKTTIISEPNDLFELLSNSSIEVNDLKEINEDVVAANWCYKEEAAVPLPTVNVVIASYVTTQARLKLYSYLEPLGERALYCDTDSVVYISRPGQHDLATGNFLGDLTNELQEFGEQAYITEFVSGGPKNYAFAVYCPESGETKTKIRVKGLVLDYKNSKRVNINTIKYLLDHTDQKVVVESKRIRATKQHSVVSQTETKTYRINFSKRRLIEDYESVPYGFKKMKTKITA